jgi:hypothetical protein
MNMFQKKKAEIILVMICGFIIALQFIINAGRVPNQPQPVVKTYTIDDYKDSAVYVGKQIIKDHLKDPYSAKFECFARPLNGQNFVFETYCTVRAKNSFGAYVPHTFIVEVTLGLKNNKIVYVSHRYFDGR